MFELVSLDTIGLQTSVSRIASFLLLYSKQWASFGSALLLLLDAFCVDCLVRTCLSESYQAHSVQRVSFEPLFFYGLVFFRTGLIDCYWGHSVQIVTLGSIGSFVSIGRSYSHKII